MSNIEILNQRCIPRGDEWKREVGGSIVKLFYVWKVRRNSFHKVEKVQLSKVFLADGHKRLRNSLILSLVIDKKRDSGCMLICGLAMNHNAQRNDTF